MRYIFTAGSFPNLSYAELRSVLELFGYNPDSVKKFSEKTLITDSKDLTDDAVLRIFQKLGGFTRVGKEIEDLDTFLFNFDDFHKIVFGISLISQADKREDKSSIEKLSRQIKKYFISKKISCRFVLPKKTELNSAQVIRNQILEKGFELVISDNGREKIYSQTIDVQDVDAFSRRDMERPYVDVDTGTLPPKLARIMVNFAQVKEGGVVWDPFCGSGTILLESLLSGINVLGSDIDPKALMYTEENIKWLSENNLIGDIKYDLFQLDILNPNRRIVNQIKNTGVDAVICEPYMGPPQKRYIDYKEADKLLNNVRDLYINLFDILSRISFEGFRVVIVIPSYKTKSGWKSLSLGDIVDKRWNLENKKYGRDLKWKRNNSIIMRNIFILTKK